MSLHILVMNSRNNDTRRVTFDRLPVSIGRHEYNSLQLLDPGVSRFHASIEWTAAQIVVTDLGSANGTFYRGFPLPACEPFAVDGEQFSIAVGPFHLAVTRRLPARASISELEATRTIDPVDLEWLRRPHEGVTVVRSRPRR